MTFNLSWEAVLGHWHKSLTGSAGPYVTSVGGTTSFNPERGSQSSGGGFSAHFERPEYQDVAVPTFLGKLKSKYAGYYKCVCILIRLYPFLLCHPRSPVGRGVPDIAVQSMRYALQLEGRLYSISSTSRATNVRIAPSLFPPLFAANPRALD